MSAASPSRPGTQNGRRSNSLVGGFIKRTKSNDLLGDRKISSNFLRNKLAEGEYDQTQSPTGVPSTPPRLPVFAPPPQLQSFGGDNYAPKMESASATTASATQPVIHNRTDSITNRGRYSYATSTISSLNSPRKVRRRKDPTAYNVLVIGAKNSGKTSFVNFLRSSLAPDPKQQNARNPELDYPPPSTKINLGNFVQHYQELEVEHERIGLSIWDSQGFEKNVIDYQLRGLNDFVESKFEDTFIEEMKVVRAPGYRDTHIHCVFYLFNPAQLDMNINAARSPANEGLGSLRKPTRIVGALDEDFELQILKSLQGKTTVIPVISKADTVTVNHMAYLKKMVGESFQKAGLNPLEALHFESDNEDRSALDEVEEESASEEEEGLKTDETKAEPVQELKTEEATEGSSNGTPSSLSGDNSDNTAEEQQANTGKPLTHKRENSKVSVSTVMFDNGYMPMSILNPDEYSLEEGNGPAGRRYAWGFADPYNPDHSDFVKLKETCFTEWRADFREASREVFYERWRTGRLNRPPVNGLKKSVLPPTSRKVSSGIPIELSPRGKMYS